MFYVCVRVNMNIGVPLARMICLPPFTDCVDFYPQCAADVTDQSLCDVETDITYYYDCCETCSSFIFEL